MQAASTEGVRRFERGVTTEIFVSFAPSPDRSYSAPMPNQQFRPDPALIATLVAVAGIGNLVALTVLGLLTRMPIWASVTIVVVELAAPLIVFQVMKRWQER